jgi:hypothetical protein
MFWWFERAGELLRLEVLETQPNTFELRLIRPDGSVTVETFSSAEALAKRHQQVQLAVAHDGWSGPRGYVL